MIHPREQKLLKNVFAERKAFKFDSKMWIILPHDLAHFKQCVKKQLMSFNCCVLHQRKQVMSSDEIWNIWGEREKGKDGQWTADDLHSLQKIFTIFFYLASVGKYSHARI